jgi:hypothetical protein
MIKMPKQAILISKQEKNAVLPQDTRRPWRVRDEEQ